jgi:hypothetical protein
MLPLVATLVLWARSFWVRDGIWYTTDTTRYSVHSHHGRIWFWQLSGGRAASDFAMITAANLHRGFVWDSTPDAYCEQFVKGPRTSSIDVAVYTLDAPAVGRPAVNWQALGVRYVRNNAWLPIAQLQAGYPVARSTAIFVPHWALAVLFGLLPAVPLVRALRRRQRVRQGRCPSCGYDLRGSPNRCPECGTATEPIAAK